MYKWLCYDEDTVFYIQAATREEAQAIAEMHDGHVVCPTQPLGEHNVDRRPQ